MVKRRIRRRIQIVNPLQCDICFSSNVRQYGSQRDGELKYYQCRNCGDTFMVETKLRPNNEQCEAQRQEQAERRRDRGDQGFLFDDQ